MFLGTMYLAEDARQVIKGWQEFMATAPDEIGGSMIEFSTIGEDPDYSENIWGKKVISIVGVWAGPADEGEKAVQPLRELAEPAFDMSGQMDYCDIQQLYDPLFPKGGHRAYFKSTYLGDLTDDMIDEIASRCANSPSDLTLTSIWYMGGATARVATDATAFGPRDMGWMLSIDGIWLDASDDAENLNWARTFWGDMKHYSNGRAYLIFAGQSEEGEELVRTSYGADNYKRLKALKAKYDPENLFRLNQNIKPEA